MSECVTIEMVTVDRIPLYSNLTGRIEKMGMNYASCNSRGPGIDLPDDWPAGVDSQPTLSELVVVTRKLGMKIVITNLNVVPVDYEKPGGDAEKAG